MGAKKGKYKKVHLMSHTRPPTYQAQTSLSSRVTRKLIRSHHTLQKQLSSALSSNNDELATLLKAQLNESGGLQTYQRASMTGQSSERGGDSSRVLMEWLACVIPKSDSKSLIAGVTSTNAQELKYKLLEVGALSPYNACSRSKLFQIQRIDLHSQHASILEQDFMSRPVPSADDLEHEGFDLVSLSLVVNFVPDAAGRGEMLKRVRRFLRNTGKDNEDEQQQAFFPGLFLVLPSSCVENSRYLDEKRLETIMRSLGYVLLRRKMSNKLVYYFWKYEAEPLARSIVFKKEEVRKGGGRNNFAIVLRKHGEDTQ